MTLLKHNISVNLSVHVELRSKYLRMFLTSLSLH